MDDAGFLLAIRNNPNDDVSRLVYADWLDERGDIRGEFLRLHLGLKALAPDHLHRVSGEHELSFLRKNIDAEWLAMVEPERNRCDGPVRDNPGQENPYRSDKCFYAGYGNRKRSEVKFHVETQDTECDAWKCLLDLIEQAAAEGRSEFAPLREMNLNDRRQIITLPPTIAKLKSVKRLYLYASHLVRIPAEIGEMSSLEEFIPYTSYGLHWFPYEITRCNNLRKSAMSTRALYGNYKYRPTFPRLRPRVTSAQRSVEPKQLSLKRWKTESVRNCSVCGQPFEDRRRHRVWISLRLATDVLPLLVNACSEECIKSLPKPPDNYVPNPHRGGVGVKQPPGY
jgi:uncharacterized protein (TIGR02996 family)